MHFSQGSIVKYCPAHFNGSYVIMQHVPSGFTVLYYVHTLCSYRVSHKFALTIDMWFATLSSKIFSKNMALIWSKFTQEHVAQWQIILCIHVFELDRGIHEELFRESYLDRNQSMVLSFPRSVVWITMIILEWIRILLASPGHWQSHEPQIIAFRLKGNWLNAMNSTYCTKMLTPWY